MRVPGWLGRAALYAGATLLVAAAYYVAMGRAAVGTDQMYALTWGSSIAHGTLPNYRSGPTAHPLINLAATLLTPLGRNGAYDTARVMGTIYLAAAVVLVFALARELAGAAAGVLAAALLGTSYGVLSYAMASSYDIPALALLLGAALSAMHEERPGWRTALLLALAGLMRPEVWGFCLLYSGYAVWRGEGRGRLLVAALPLAAPVLWGLSDWIITGHPRFSFTHTRDLTQLLGRSTGLGAVPHAVADGLRVQASNAVIIAGLVGIALAATTRRRLRFLPLVLILLGLLAGYALNGFEKLSLIARYLLPASAVLSIFAAYTAVGWIRERDSRVPRPLWAGAGVIVLVVLAASIPDRLDALRSVKHSAQAMNTMQDDLRALVPRLPACQPIHTWLGYVNFSATLRYELGDWSPPSIALGDAPHRGVFLAPRSSRDTRRLRDALLVGATKPRDFLLHSNTRATPPHLAGRVRHTRHWSWSVVGCQPS